MTSVTELLHLGGHLHSHLPCCCILSPIQRTWFGRNSWAFFAGKVLIWSRVIGLQISELSASYSAKEESVRVMPSSLTRPLSSGMWNVSAETSVVEEQSVEAAFLLL